MICCNCCWWNEPPCCVVSDDAAESMVSPARRRPGWLMPSPVVGVDDGPRNVVALGMSRFETEAKKEQPPWEVLSDRVVSVLGSNPSDFTLNGTNCYLVGTGASRLLVDAAERYYGNASFMQNLEDAMASVRCTSLDGIIITHMHSDHYGGMEALQDKYGPVPVYISDICIERNPHFSKDIWEELETHDLLDIFVDPSSGMLRYSPFRDSLPSASDAPFNKMAGVNFDFLLGGGKQRANGKGTGIADPKAFFRSKGKGKGKGASPEAGDAPAFEHVGVAVVISFMWESIRFRAQLTSGRMDWQRLESMQTIKTEGVTLRCHPAPGHSEDHFVFFIQEENALLSGDHVLGHGTTFVTDMHDYMQTLQTMLELRPARLYPGHGPYIADGMGLLSRYRDHRQARIAQIASAIDLMECNTFRPADIARALYANTLEERMDMASDNVERVLRQLVHEGKLDLVTVDPGQAVQVVPMPSSYTVFTLPAELSFRLKNASALGANGNSGLAESKL